MIEVKVIFAVSCKVIFQIEKRHQRYSATCQAAILEIHLKAVCTVVKKD